MYESNLSIKICLNFIRAKSTWLLNEMINIKLIGSVLNVSKHLGFMFRFSNLAQL